MSTTLTISSGSLVVDASETIQTVSGGTDDENVGLISRDGQRTIVFIPAVADSDHKFVQLPSDAEVGDVVEIYCDAPSINPNINLPSGDTLAAGRSPRNGYGIYRKVGSTVWAYL